MEDLELAVSRRMVVTSTPPSREFLSLHVDETRLTNLSCSFDSSSTGIVNLYDSSSTVPESGQERKAFKAIGNLTTAVTSMRFNHDSQILALASRTNKDQLKLVSSLSFALSSCSALLLLLTLPLLPSYRSSSVAQVHLPSATVFSNWPTQQTPLHHVTAMDFSRGSEWLAVGNARGKVLLYSVKDFAGGKK